MKGFSNDKVQSSFIFTNYDGHQYRGMPVPVVAGKLKRRQSLTADDFAFLKKRTRRTAKATLPSPSANHFFSGYKSLAHSPYRDRQAFFADVCAIYQEEIADLGRLGCTYLQLDEVPIAVLCDRKNQDRVRERGEDPEELIEDYIAAINEAVRDRPSVMTVCVHLCRGNAGHGQASGGYDPVAEQLLQGTNVDGFFLEYDTERAGDFRPLRFLPKDKVAVLGIISTKLRELKSVDEVKRRIEDASRYADQDRLCLSPQCGFASAYTTDRMSLDDQERKLAHMVIAFLRTNSGTQASETGQLQRRTPDVESHNSAEQVELESLDPADCQADVTREREVDAGPRRCHTDPLTVIWIVLADGGRRQNSAEVGNRIQNGLNEGVRVGSRPSAVVSIRSESVVLDHATDFRNELLGTLAVDRHDGVRHRSKPPTVRREPIGADGFAPCRVVVPTVVDGTPFFDDDPGMDCKDAAPPHGASGEDPDHGLRARRRGRQQAGARPVCGLPIFAAVIKTEIVRGRERDRQEHEQEKDDQRLFQRENTGGMFVGDM